MFIVSKNKFSIATKLSALLLFIVSVFGLTACDYQFRVDRPIIIISRDSASGTREAFFTLLFGSKQADIRLKLGSIELNSTAAILARVSSDPQSIGYDSLGFVNDSVKLLPVDKYLPTTQNILDDKYKLWRPLSVLYRIDRMKQRHLSAFNDFLQSQQAQDIVQSRGYVNFPSSEGYAEYKPIADLVGTIRVSGSTTVEPMMQRLREKFLDYQPNCKIELTAAGSGPGRNDIKNDNSDFGMQSAVVTQSHIDDIEQGAGVGNVGQTNLAIDAIAVIVHSSNYLGIPKSDLTDDIQEQGQSVTMQNLANLIDNDSGVSFATWKAMLEFQ
ncbi:MAG: substrate-binding domain-containing protein [Clostridiales bacterium]|jgi:phosphate transport system substrate-binding protein|nr:substrate-binding domain-containing protein [Clostridiales bacterium]